MGPPQGGRGSRLHPPRHRSRNRNVRIAKGESAARETGGYGSQLRRDRGLGGPEDYSPAERRRALEANRSVRSWLIPDELLPGRFKQRNRPGGAAVCLPVIYYF